MPTNLEALADELKLDRSEWSIAKFGDVAIQQKQSVDRDNTDLTRYVKGEHMHSEDIHLREWGELQDEYLGPAFIRKFEKGDILYGSRRTYLKKVVIAPFEGITSNTTFVIKANEQVIDKRLLPFLMLSEGFTEHSIRNSKGSVNPYVNWKDLANYEFLLPPKEQQAELAELFRSMDDVNEKHLKLIKQSKRTLETKIENSIHGIDLDEKTINKVINELSRTKEVIALNDCGLILKGKGIPKKDVVDSGIPCIRYGELYTKHHRIIRSYSSFIDMSVSETSFKLEKNDVLFAGSGETITEIGKSAAFVYDEEAYAGGDILVFRPKEMDGLYLGYLMNSQLVRQQLNKFGTGATVMHIYPDDLKKIKIPFIDLKEQIEFGKTFNRFEVTISLMMAKKNDAINLQKSIINQVF